MIMRFREEMQCLLDGHDVLACLVEVRPKCERVLWQGVASYVNTTDTLC
jgi:hypothetical protein